MTASETTVASPQPLHPHPQAATILWIVAILTFGVADTALTVYGLSNGLAVEANPLPAFYAETYSAVSLVFLKASFMLSQYIAYRLVPREWRVGIPIGLAGLGVPVTLWNGYVLMLA